MFPGLCDLKQRSAYLRLRVDGGRCKAIAFRHADTAIGAALAGARGRAFYIAGRVKRDDWKGEPSAEIEIDDIAWA